MQIQEIVDLALQKASPDKFEDVGDLAMRCAQDRGRAIPQDAFEQAIAILEQRCELKREASRVKRVELDAKEPLFYPSLEKEMRRPAFIAKLGLAHCPFVFHETAMGGASGTGQFPDPTSPLPPYVAFGLILSNTWT